MTKVNDINGNEIDFEAACNLIDGELAEDMDGMFDEGEEQGYIEEYAKRHAEKHGGEEFAPFFGLAW